jgi:hypothetical protein
MSNPTYSCNSSASRLLRISSRVGVGTLLCIFGLLVDLQESGMRVNAAGTKTFLLIV